MDQQRNYSSALLTPGLITILKRFSIYQIMRYGIIGSMAAATQYLAVILIVELAQADPVYANMIGYCCGFVISLTGHRLWTFATTTRHIKLIVPHLLLTTSLNFTINQSAFYFLYRHLHFHYTNALILCIIVATSVTFLLNKFWVFRD